MVDMQPKPPCITKCASCFMKPERFGLRRTWLGKLKDQTPPHMQMWWRAFATGRPRLMHAPPNQGPSPCYLKLARPPALLSPRNCQMPTRGALGRLAHDVASQHQRRNVVGPADLGAALNFILITTKLQKPSHGAGLGWWPLALYTSRVATGI